MDTTRKLLVALCLILATSLGFACSCSFQSLDDAAIQNSKHIFVFRLLNVAIDQPRATSDELIYSVVGAVEVVETLRGNGLQFRHVRFTTFSCCATRLDVGHTYVAFVSNNGPEFEGNIGTLLKTSIDLTEIVAGRAKLPASISEATRRNISEVLPPPPRPQKGES